MPFPSREGHGPPCRVSEGRFGLAPPLRAVEASNAAVEPSVLLPVRHALRQGGSVALLAVGARELVPPLLRRTLRAATHALLRGDRDAGDRLRQERFPKSCRDPWPRKL